MTKTLRQFSRELDVAFESVSEEELNELLKPWEGDNEQRLKTFFINQFESWPDVLKNQVTINVQIDLDPDYPGHHCFLSFESVDLRKQDLTGANLAFANLRGARLRGACLRDANLEEAELAFAELSDANLRGACLLGACLRGANLEKAELEETILTEAELAFANLSNANLRDADLEDADLEDANLSNANLEGAKGLVDRYQNKHITLGAGTTGVTINSKTILPDELLYCYFNSELYPKKEGVIENPPTFDKWARQNFVALYKDSSRRIVTPPQSRFNLEVTGDINEWVLAMLPRLEEAWNKREQDSTRSEIQKFLNGLKAAAQQG